MKQFKYDCCEGWTKIYVPRELGQNCPNCCQHKPILTHISKPCALCKKTFVISLEIQSHNTIYCSSCGGAPDWEGILKGWCDKNNTPYTDAKTAFAAVMEANDNIQRRAAIALGVTSNSFWRRYRRLYPDYRRKPQNKPRRIDTISDEDNPETYPKPVNYDLDWDGNKSPCLQCDLLKKNKNNKWCPDCKKRIAYLVSIMGLRSNSFEYAESSTGGISVYGGRTWTQVF